jgi:hypothetical protein
VIDGIEGARLADQVMEPYRSARRVFWVVDDGTSIRETGPPDAFMGFIPA